MKLLRAGEGASASQMSARILHEGRVLARVRHPSVVTVYGAEDSRFVAVFTTLNAYLRGWLNFFGTSCTDAVVRTLHTLDARGAPARFAAAAVEASALHRPSSYPDGSAASTAWRVVYEGCKALWALSHCGPVDYALDKRHFAYRGLISLEHRYRVSTASSPPRS